MNKLEAILLTAVAILTIGWNVYMSNIGKSIESKINAEIYVCKDSIENPLRDVIIYYDSISCQECNDSNAIAFIGASDMQHKHIVYAQMRLESGNYKSRIATENNNYFGMKPPKLRLTYAIGENNGYATYENWYYSILDYALWQKEYAYDLSEEEYLRKLSVYAEDKNYVNKIKQISKTYYAKVKSRNDIVY